jgi:hypothetical protein
MSQDIINNLIKSFPSELEEDGPYLLIGKEAKLGPLRLFQNTALLDNYVITDLPQEESLLCHIPSANIFLTLPFKSISVSCQIFVTSRRLLAVASSEQEGDKDIMLNAQGISLHALTSEPQRTIYCQLCEHIHVGSSDDDGTRNTNDMDEEEEEEEEGDSYVTKELTIVPLTRNNEQDSDLCSSLFQALSKLIALNPVDDDDQNFGGGSFGDMLGLMAQAYGQVDDNDQDDEMICRINPKDISTYTIVDEEESNVHGNRRRAILEHLDNVLVVPEEYEVVDGQFDDACSEQHDEEDRQLSEEDDRIL